MGRVEFRDMPWRATGVLVTHRPQPLPKLLDAVLVAVVCGYLLVGLGGAPPTRAEAQAVALRHDAVVLLTDPQRLLPGSASDPARERARLAGGAFTRYAVAAGWYAAGGRDQARPVLTRDPAGSGGIPAGLVVPARTGPALLACGGALLLFLIARYAAGRRAAAVAVLLYGLDPQVLDVGRRATDAGIVAALGLLTVLLAARAARATTAGRAALGPWMALAIAGGLDLAAGHGALAYLLGATAWCLVAAARARRRGGRTGLPSLAVAVLGGAAVAVVVTPALWGWLPERLASRASTRDALLAGADLTAWPGGIGPAPLAAAGSARAAGGPWWWSGLPWWLVGPPVGIVLVVAAVLGVGLLSRPGAVLAGARPGAERVGALGVLGWFAGATVWAGAAADGLAEARYVLLAPGCLLAAVALVTGAEAAVRAVRSRGAPVG